MSLQDFLKAILAATRSSSPNQSDEAPTIRLTAFKSAIAALASPNSSLTDSQAGDLAALLESELSGTPDPSDLSHIAHIALEAFEADALHSCAALGILPRTLTLLSASTTTTTNNATTDTIPAVSSHATRGIIQRVCHHPWPSTSVVKIIAILKDFPFIGNSTNSNNNQQQLQQLQDIASHAVIRSRSSDIQDLPAIAHQLLALSSKGAQVSILSHIIAMVSKRAAKCRGGGEGGQVAIGQDDANQQQQQEVAQYKAVQQVAGSVLLHIDMAAKHDNDLVSSWMKWMKNAGPLQLSPFSLAVCFIFAGVHRFQQPALDALKNTIIAVYKDTIAAEVSPWLPKAAREGIRSSAILLERNIVNCAADSKYGHTGVVQPMALLAAALLDAVPVVAAQKMKIASSATASSASSAASSSSSHSSPHSSQYAQSKKLADKLSNLATIILVQLFDGHRDCRKELIQMACSKLIRSKESAALPWVTVIACLIRQDPPAFATHELLPVLKTAMEGISFLPPGAALGLLLASWPMCSKRRDAKDFVIMLLRKAMFSRELNTRLLAARGFLLLMVEEMNDGGLFDGTNGSIEKKKREQQQQEEGEDEEQYLAAGPSQVTSMSQRGTLGGGSNHRGGGTGDGPKSITGNGNASDNNSNNNATGVTLLHELMGFLRRSLSQQPEVRRAVYNGLPALLQADPSAAEPVMELLLPHFAQFYESNEALNPPLKLEGCVKLVGHGGGGVGGGGNERAKVVEPLQYQVSCILQLIRTADDNNNNNNNNTGGDETTQSDKETQNDDADNDDGDGDARKTLKKCMSSLRHRIATSTLESFDLDSSREWGASLPSGELNQGLADVLLGCMEALLEDLVDQVCRNDGDGDDNDASGRFYKALSPVAKEHLGTEILAIFGQHKRLVDLAYEGGKAVAGGKKKKQGGVGVGQKRWRSTTMNSTINGGGGDPSSSLSRPPSHHYHNNNAVLAAAAASASSLSSTTTAVVSSGTVTTVAHRLPVLSPHCIGRLLDAIVDDGLVKNVSNDSPHAELARDEAFHIFVFNAAIRQLQQQQLSSSSNYGDNGGIGDGAMAAALVAGTAGDGKACKAAQNALGIPDSLSVLAPPLLEAAQTFLLSRAGIHNNNNDSSGGGGWIRRRDGGTVEKSATLAAISAIDQLLTLAVHSPPFSSTTRSDGGDNNSSSSSLLSLADVLVSGLQPSREIDIKAAGLEAAVKVLEQRMHHHDDDDDDDIYNEMKAAVDVCVRLPCFKDILDCLAEGGCGKEVEIMCRIMCTIAHLMPRLSPGGVVLSVSPPAAGSDGSRENDDANRSSNSRKSKREEECSVGAIMAGWLCDIIARPPPALLQQGRNVNTVKALITTAFHLSSLSPTVINGTAVVDEMMRNNNNNNHHYRAAVIGGGEDLKLAYEMAAALKAAYNGNIAAGINGHQQHQAGTIAGFTQLVGDHFAIFSTKSLPAVSHGILAHIDAAFVTIDWSLNRFMKTQQQQATVYKLVAGSSVAAMGIFLGGDIDTTHAPADSGGVIKRGDKRGTWEPSIFHRLSSLASLVQIMVEIRFEAGSPIMEHVLLTTTAFYRLLTLATKSQFALRNNSNGGGEGGEMGPPCSEFRELVQEVNGQVTNAVYNFLSEIQNVTVVGGAEERDGDDLDSEQSDDDDDDDKGDEDGNQMKKKKKGGKGKKKNSIKVSVSHAKRESQLFPNLIFAIEDYEKHLIKLDKVCKSGLMWNAKRSANRDFKLKLLDRSSGGCDNGGGGERMEVREEEEQRGEEEEEGMMMEDEEEEEGVHVHEEEMVDAEEKEEEGGEEEEEDDDNIEKLSWVVRESDVE